MEELHLKPLEQFMSPDPTEPRRSQDSTDQDGGASSVHDADQEDLDGEDVGELIAGMSAE